MILKLKSAAVLALILAGASCSKPSAPAHESGALPPNLLFISVDTLRADALGSYGGTGQATPFMDRFANAGTRFDSAWTHSPKTAPAHMSMFTGLPPRAHGVGNQKSKGNQRLSNDITTLAESLQAAGYRTGAVTSGGNVKGYLGFDRGFEVYEDAPKKLPKKLGDAKRWIKGVAQENGAAARPWFFFFHTYAVHDPYMPPLASQTAFVDADYAGEIIGDGKSLRAAIETDDRAAWASAHQKVAENFWARVDASDPKDLEYLRQLYMSGVAEFDRQVREFLYGLRREGLLENTIVVLTSDHGEEFGEHGDTRHNQLWREVLHVPLIVHMPGDELVADQPGRVITSAVRHMDLVPSLIDLMGLGNEAVFNQAMLGESWADWVAPNATHGPSRAVLSEHRSKLNRPLDLWSLRKDGLLVIVAEPGGEARFVDLAKDPQEASSGTASENTAAQRALLDLRAFELGRFQKAAESFGAGAGVELDAQSRAELEALGYL